MDATKPDLYRVLQVDPAANSLVVQAAYRVLARIFHPDADAGGDDEQMKRINAAWEILGDPRRRAQYDVERAGRHPGRVQASDRAPDTAPWQSSTGRTGGQPAQAAQAAPQVAADDRAGPPQGTPFGPVLWVGRYAGWSIGQVARIDRPFLEWLRDAPAGRSIRSDIDDVLSTRKGPGAVDERRHYETIRGRVPASVL